MLVSDSTDKQIISVNNADESLGGTVCLSKQLAVNFPLMPGTRYAVHNLPATSCATDSSLGLVGMQMVGLG